MVVALSPKKSASGDKASASRTQVTGNRATKISVKMLGRVMRGNMSEMFKSNIPLGPKVVKVTDKSISSDRGKKFHPMMEAKNAAETFRAVRQGGNRARQYTFLSQAFNLGS